MTIQNQMEIFTLSEQLPNIFSFLASDQVFWASFQFKYVYYKFPGAFQISHALWVAQYPVAKTVSCVVMPFLIR